MLARLLRATDARRFRHAVITLMHGGTLEEEIRALGVPVYHAGLRRGGISLSTPFALARVIGFLRREQPDVVHGWMVHGSLAAQFARPFLSPAPRVLWAVHHSPDALRREKRLTAALIRFSARLSRRAGAPHGVVYVSHESRAQHEALGYDRARAVVIPNGIDTEHFAPSREHRLALRCELGLPPETLLLGLMGRFHPQKNHAGFLRAAERVLAEHPGAGIVLAGHGMEPGNAALAALMRGNRHALGDRVRLLGERRDMERITAGLDIAVSASAYGEALSLALCEAMACGVPCVTTDVGDHRRLVEGTGVVVAPGDPDALAEGCRSLLLLGREERRALGARARERILRHYALPETARRYEELYQTPSRALRKEG